MQDMTPFLSLLKSEQKLTFELDNNVEGIYTGLFNVTLTSQFLTTDIVPSVPADRILGVTNTAASGGPKTFSVPEDSATAALTIPRNVKRAVFTLSATGQSAEEVRFNLVASVDCHSDQEKQTLTLSRSFGGAMYQALEPQRSAPTAHFMATRPFAKFSSTLTA